MSGFNSGAIDPALLSGSSANHNNASSSNLSHESTTTSATEPNLTNPSQSGAGLINPAQLMNHRPTPQSTSLAPALPLQSSANVSSSLSQSSTTPAAPTSSLALANNLGLNPPSSSFQPLSQTGTAPPPPTSAKPTFPNGYAPSQSTPKNAEPVLANGMPSKEHEMHQKDQELAQFLLKMEEYKPVIPDEVAAYYLQRVGFECTDLKVQRLLVLACQKFVSDIAQDAFSYARTRTGQAPGGRQGPLAPMSNSAGLSNGLPNNPGARKDRTRTVLTQEDLAQALAEYGINASRAPYYL